MSSKHPYPRSRGFWLVVSLFVTVFLATVVLRSLATSVLGTYRSLGFHSPSNGFYLYRYLLFATLPLAFNFLFGLYFALRFYRSRLPSHAHKWGGLLLFLAWVVVFNLPAASGGWPLEWPPPKLYQPVYMELVLFVPMGNLGALLGFATGGLVGHARRAREGASGV